MNSFKSRKKKQVSETWFKRDPFLWQVPHNTSPLPRYIFCFTSTRSLQKKKKYNGSQSSIVTFKNKTTMHCYASGKATIEKKKIPYQSYYEVSAGAENLGKCTAHTSAHMVTAAAAVAA